MGQCCLVDRTSLAKPSLTKIIHSSYAPVMACSGHGQSRASTSYIFICSLGELQVIRTNKLCHAEDKNLASIYGQDMEILMTESYMYLLDIKSSPSLNGQNSNMLNLLTKNNLEAQNRRRDTSIPSVSAGLNF